MLELINFISLVSIVGGVPPHTIYPKIIGCKIKRNSQKMQGINEIFPYSDLKQKKLQRRGCKTENDDLI